MRSMHVFVFVAWIRHRLVGFFFLFFFSFSFFSAKYILLGEREREREPSGHYSSSATKAVKMRRPKGMSKRKKREFHKKKKK